MKSLLTCLLAIFSLCGTTNGMLVIAEWTDFAAPYSATGGPQTADLNVMVNGGGPGITDGTDLQIRVNDTAFNDPGTFLDLTVDTTQFEDIVLAYEVVKSDGGGPNNAPDTINWSYFLDGSTTATAAGTNAIGAGTNSEMIDLSAIFDVDNASSVRLRGTFSGANGGSSSSLTFDNIQVSATAVPEPSAFIFLAVVLGLGYGWRFACPNRR